MSLILAWGEEAGGSLWVQDQLHVHSEIPSQKREDIFKSLHASKYYMQNQKQMENWEEISYEACCACESSKPGKWLISKEHSSDCRVTEGRNTTCLTMWRWGGLLRTMPIGWVWDFLARLRGERCPWHKKWPRQRGERASHSLSKTDSCNPSD